MGNMGTLSRLRLDSALIPHNAPLSCIASLMILCGALQGVLGSNVPYREMEWGFMDPFSPR